VRGWWVRGSDWKTSGLLWSTEGHGLRTEFSICVPRYTLRQIVSNCSPCSSVLHNTFQGFEFEAQGLRITAQPLEFGVCGSELGDTRLGIGDWGLGIGVWLFGFGFKV
jgi:hypothetical protein